MVTQLPVISSADPAGQVVCVVAGVVPVVPPVVVVAGVVVDVDGLS
jgi:hypothetical protein